jgi:ribosomal protein L37E
MKVHSRLCRRCGNEFQTTHNSKMYCSDRCYRDAQNSRKREETQSRKKQRKNVTLIDLTVEARKHGMSYGQYVARMGL